MSRPPDISQLLQQAQQMQEQMMATQAELSTRQYEGSSGGGVVKVIVVDSRVKSVSVDPGVIDPSDPEMLADLILVAVNQALQAAATDASQEIGGVTGGLDLGDLGLG